MQVKWKITQVCEIYSNKFISYSLGLILKSKMEDMFYYFAPRFLDLFKFGLPHKTYDTFQSWV